jgi:FkbM family methyltransferase
VVKYFCRERLGGILSIVSYSQFGEDQEIVSYFGKKYNGIFLDVGANNGVRDSNSLLLEEFGWTGILVEANPVLAHEASTNRPLAIVVNAAVAATSSETDVPFYKVWKRGSNLDGLSSLCIDDKTKEKILENGGTIECITVKTLSIDAIIADHLPVGTRIDFVSLDIEGTELVALQGFDIRKHRPRLVVIEDNSRGHDRRILTHMTNAGYMRVHRTGWNDWYVRTREFYRFLFLKWPILQLRLFKWRFERQVKR